MIHDPYQFRIFALDPGTDTIGIVVLGLDIPTGTITLLHGQTIHSGKMVEEQSVGCRYFGARHTRLQESKEAIKELLFYWDPHSVVHESPFMRKFAQAFQALSECIETSIRGAVYEWDPSNRIEFVDPPTAKLAVGATWKGKKGKGLTKGDIRTALLQQNFPVAPGVNPLLWDEHTVDAAAVGVWKAKLLMGTLLND